MQKITNARAILGKDEETYLQRSGYRTGLVGEVEVEKIPKNRLSASPSQWNGVLG